jgi:Flp pilus assembly protein TadD
VSRNVVFASVAALVIGLVAYKVWPRSTHDWGRVGYQALEDGRTQDAIAALREAIKVAPDDAATRYNLAVALERAGYAPEALAEYQAAHRLEPSTATYRTGLAHTKRTLGYRAGVAGKHEEAVRLYKEVLELTPDDATTWYNLSVSYQKLGKADESHRARTRASLLHPKYKFTVPN